MRKHTTTVIFQGTEDDFDPEFSVTTHAEVSIARLTLTQYSSGFTESTTSIALDRGQAAALIAALTQFVEG